MVGVDSGNLQADSQPLSQLAWSERTEWTLAMD